jgi:hypothetical protein
MHDTKEKSCLLINIAIQDDSNGNTKETDKLSKYKDPEIVSRMRTKIVPVIIGALGTNKEGLNRNLQLFPGYPLVKELQKITLMSSANIIRKVLWYLTVISCRDLD